MTLQRARREENVSSDPRCMETSAARAPDPLSLWVKVEKMRRLPFKKPRSSFKLDFRPTRALFQTRFLETVCPAPRARVFSDEEKKVGLPLNSPFGGRRGSAGGGRRGSRRPGKATVRRRSGRRCPSCVYQDAERGCAAGEGRRDREKRPPVAGDSLRLFLGTGAFRVPRCLAPTRRGRRRAPPRRSRSSCVCGRSSWRSRPS